MSVFTQDFQDSPFDDSLGVISAKTFYNASNVPLA